MLANTWSPEQWAFVIGIVTTSLVSLIQAFRNGNRVKDVHTMVDGMHSREVARADQLTQALQDSNVTIPPIPVKDGP